MNPIPSDRHKSLSSAKQALLAKRLAGASDSTGGISEILPRTVFSPAPLSFGQQRLWYLHQVDPASAAYTMYQALRIRGPLESPVLEKSLNHLVGRHEALRTTFHLSDGQVVQVVAESLTVSLPIVSLETVPVAERERNARERANETIRLPFDLSKGPLLRARLLRLEPTDHVLALSMHHIIADEWSLDVLWNEWAELYRSILSDNVSSLPDPPLQYADYACWQNARLSHESFQQGLAYWKRRLEGELPALSLPTDHPRPVYPSFSGALESKVIPTPVADALRQLSVREGVTLFVLLLAAFKTLLYRYTGQADLIVGAPATNRNRYELERVVGFFINALVLRSDLSGRPSFLETLRRVRGVVQDALKHQDVPFERLVDALNPERSLNQNPLFQVMFVLQHAPEIDRLAPDVFIQVFPVESGASKFDLTLFVSEADGALTASIEYNTDLFDASTIRRLLDNWEVLLEGITSTPEKSIADLPLLSDSERRLLTEWNPPVPSSSPTYGGGIHRMFEAHAERSPHAVALTFEDEETTYGVLNERADRLARHLTACGVGPNVCVGLYVERSPEMIVGILGILKAGGAYVPLDPAYPEPRLRFMVEDTHALLVLTTRLLRDNMPDFRVPVMAVDEVYLADPPLHEDHRDISIDGRRLAYVIYTSGSTGNPKGAPVSHTNLVSSTTARFAYYPDHPGRFLLLSSFAFDSSVAGIFWTLCSGGTLVLPRQRLEQDLYELADLIRRYRITHTLCLPSLYRLMLEQTSPEQLGTLRTVIVAGEACPPDLAVRHYERLPGTSLFNEYGPTEGTVWSTVYAIPRDFSAARVPIGRPVTGVEAYVLDTNRNLNPIGVPGELYLGGRGLVEGYLNRPDLTAERFIPHPFSDDPTARLYRTGDLVRFTSGGYLEFIGRTDNQIKLRGYRIEPGEIESVLALHPSVRECAVVERPVVHPADHSNSSGWDSSPVPDDDTNAALLAALSELDRDEALRLLEIIERIPAETSIPVDPHDAPLSQIESF